MSLALIGRGASYEFRWRRWALLRDTVAMHLEDGRTGSRYPHLAQLGDAIVEPRRIDASALATEAAEVREKLGGMPIEKLAIGEATAAVLYHGAHIAAPRLLNDTELAQVAPVGTAADLREYFQSMIDSIADVCRHPHEDGKLEVIDG